MSKTKDEILYDYVMSFIGRPYLWGGNNPLTGLDCSGFVLECLRSVGHWPAGEDDNCAGIHVRLIDKGWTKGSPRFGAVAFFGAPGLTHVALCLSETTMIEAGGGGSGTVSAAMAAAQGAFVRVRPIGNRKDLSDVLLAPG